jgi:hypothetical protein
MDRGGREREGLVIGGREFTTDYTDSHRFCNDWREFTTEDTEYVMIGGGSPQITQIRTDFVMIGMWRRGMPRLFTGDGTG